MTQKYTTETTSQAIAQNLRRLIKSHGISQHELAEQISSTDAAISRYLSCSRCPQAASLLTLADAFGVTVDEIVRPSQE